MKLPVTFVILASFATDTLAQNTNLHMAPIEPAAETLIQPQVLIEELEGHELFGGGPIIVGSGAGLAEYFLILSKSKLADLVGETIENQTKELSLRETQMLQALRQWLLDHMIDVQFTQEAEAPVHQWDSNRDAITVNQAAIANPDSPHFIADQEQAIRFWLTSLNHHPDWSESTLSSSVTEVLVSNFNTQSRIVRQDLADGSPLTFVETQDYDISTLSLQHSDFSLDLIPLVLPLVECPLHAIETLMVGSAGWRASRTLQIENQAIRQHRLDFNLRIDCGKETQHYDFILRIRSRQNSRLIRESLDLRRR